MRAKRDRRGVALIEVLIALVMVATAGTGLLTLVGQTSHAMRDVRETERLLRDASERLDHVTVLSAADFASRRGTTTLDGWLLTVTPLSASLFDVSVRPPNYTAPVLSTILYRPERDDAAR